MARRILALVAFGALALAGDRLVDFRDRAQVGLSPPAVGSRPPVAGAHQEDHEDHAEEVASYTLRARLDPKAHTVHGEGSIRFKNASQAPVRELWLHLYLNAFKNERSTFLREPAAGFRGSAPFTEWGTIDVSLLSLRGRTAEEPAEDLLPGLSFSKGEEGSPTDEDQTDARVPLPRPLLPGESLTLDVAWDDKLPSVVERTGYSGSFHFVAQWFPKLARLEPDGTWAHFPFHHLAEFYADFGTYDVTLDVPDGFQIGATGPVVESKSEGGRTIERHVQGDIHDFAWTAWDLFASKEETIAGVAVRILFPRGFQRDAERELAAVRFALPYFESLYGSYPYPTLTLVHPPESAGEAGGMEYPTLITTGGPWYGVPLTHVLELTTVHELGHQYFYGLIASNEVLWPFLDEGVNSFAEGDALGALYGPSSAVDALGLTVSDQAFQAVFANAGAHDARVAQPAYAFMTGSSYAALVYQRTATILETLHRVYGDEAMRRTMGRYTRDFRWKHPGPEDLIAAFASEMGGEAAAMLRRALFEEAWVDYAVLEVVSRPSTPARGIFDRDGKRETVKTAVAKRGDYEGWVLVARRGTLSFPVEIELTLANGEKRRVPWDGRDGTARIPYHGPSPLRAAVIDPDHAVLLDQELSNNHGAAPEAEGSGAPRVLSRATYWGELLVQVLEP
jgi:hypothetical protein